MVLLVLFVSLLGPVGLKIADFFSFLKKEKLSHFQNRYIAFCTFRKAGIGTAAFNLADLQLHIHHCIQGHAHCTVDWYMSSLPVYNCASIVQKIELG